MCWIREWWAGAVAAATAAVGSGGIAAASFLVLVGLEDLGDAVAALLHPDQAEAERGDRVPDGVVRGLVGYVDEQEMTVGVHGQPGGGERVESGAGAVRVAVGV